MADESKETPSGPEKVSIAMMIMSIFMIPVSDMNNNF